MSLRLADELPFTFFEDTIYLTNKSAGDLIIQSDPIPDGFSATITDLNSIFTTSGGSIDYAKKTRSGKVLKFATNRSSNDNGTFTMNFSEGDRVQIILNSLGAGEIDLLWHGKKTLVRIIPKSEIFVNSDKFGDGV